MMASPRPPLEIVYLAQPGRFPTVMFDPGAWWQSLAGSSQFVLRYEQANVRWWEALCDPGGLSLFAASSTTEPGAYHPRQLLQTPGQLAIDACSGMGELRTSEIYASVDRYSGAVGKIADYLQQLNASQRELDFSFENGVRVRDLNYSDSGSLAAYAKRPTRLAESIGLSLTDHIPDLVIMAATHPEELLTGMIAAQIMKQRRPDVHVCLADHGYENFSLTPHLEHLRQAGTLDATFDTIIESKDERDELVVRLAHAIKGGDRPRGYLRLADLPVAQETPSMGPPPAPIAVFSPTPIFSTRLSLRGCYWARCTFCVHNVKFPAGRAPSRATIPANVERLAAHRAAGYRSFIFTDEALSPAFLDAFCDQLIERGVAIDWICRSKLELSHDEPLFRKMRRAGCREMLFGVESISPRVLRLMDKVVAGMDAEAVGQIARAASGAGLGIHLTLIGGFPGDTVADVSRSAAFLVELLHGVPNATYQLNRFVLFAGTPVANEGERFAINVLPPRGDMPLALDYEPDRRIAQDAELVRRALPALQAWIDRELGWDRLAQFPAAREVRNLYFSSGHGALFKAMAWNPFADPLVLKRVRAVA